MSRWSLSSLHVFDNYLPVHLQSFEDDESEDVDKDGAVEVLKGRGLGKLSRPIVAEQ